MLAMSGAQHACACVCVQEHLGLVGRGFVGGSVREGFPTGKNQGFSRGVTFLRCTHVTAGARILLLYIVE